MVDFMKRVAELESELINEERSLLSIAYKNVLNAHRSSWRALSNSEHKSENSERKRQMAKEYREKIEKRLKYRCYEILVRFFQ
jgi:14-3-3 protein epsilon